MVIEAGLAKNIIEKHSQPIINKFTELIRDEWEKFKIDSDIAFLKYLNNSYEKYSKIKTVLYRTEPKYIYDFFEYPTITKENKQVDSSDINNLLDISNFLIVQGTGGIGKSTLMKHLFLNELSKKDLIPIFVELKDLNDTDITSGITDFIFKKLFTLGCELDKKYLEYALKSGCFLFLLDGYDEIITAKRDSFFKQITEFSDQYSSNYYIISSRPYSDFVEFQRFTVLNVMQLSKEQAISLVRKIDYDPDTKSHFLEALQNHLYDRHKSFASNPLLLNIMLMTYDNYAEIPQKLHLFYSNAFDTLYSKHDATKGAYKRELRCKLSYDAFKKVFSFFCFVTYYNGQIEFSYENIASILKKFNLPDIQFNTDDFIYDLSNSVCVIFKDGLNYRFTHRSFQEFFTAVYLKELPDSKMNRVGIAIIKKDKYRSSYDNTFMMLFDMCTERVEQNIIVPLLEEIEQECPEDCNKYDFYCEKLNYEMLFNESINRANRCLFLRRYDVSNLCQFIDIAFITYYAFKYIEFVDINNSKSNELLDYFIKNRNYQMGKKFTLEDLKDDHKAYDIFKSTWVGNRIQAISNLHEILSDKQDKIDNELAELLI